jgi:hypothetical protein
MGGAIGGRCWLHRWGGTAGMTVHGALRPVKISHNVEEHAEWVHVAQVIHSPRRVIGEAEYIVCQLV